VLQFPQRLGGSSCLFVVASPPASPQDGGRVWWRVERFQWFGWCSCFIITTCTLLKVRVPASKTLQKAYFGKMTILLTEYGILSPDSDFISLESKLQDRSVEITPPLLFKTGRCEKAKPSTIMQRVGSRTERRSVWFTQLPRLGKNGTSLAARLPTFRVWIQTLP
jgi:hypothetical protein